ncbi:MAG: ACT domain-containing protein [Chloroflexi bacterium]|nr:ACT domain-containing protein [Chloroflexota bacterium]
MRLTLTVLPGRLALCRLAPGAALPLTALRGPFWSLTGSAEELSLVCPEAAAPATARCEPGWRALRVEGPLDLALTGVIAAIAAPLAAAGLPILPIASFDTDYVLVRAAQLTAAVTALRGAGMIVDDNA